MRRLYTILVYLSVCACAYAQEVRAVWLATIGGIDWPHTYCNGTSSSIKVQQEELTDILDQLQAAGINTVLFQTRIRGTVVYPSKYEPWDAALSGKNGKSPGYDPLEFAIEECHKRGMELHAWVVCIPIANKKNMNPEDPQTATKIANICGELVDNYDVDGIHLDYIRYPDDWKKKTDKAKGRKAITDIVRKVNARVKGAKPWVKMSCSPIGQHDDLPRQTSNGWNARTIVMQDAQAWLNEGLMDQLYPMMYFQGNNFYPFAYDWQEQSNGRMVIPGLGIYFLSPSEKNWPLSTITQEMEVVRNLGMGHAFFRSKFLTDNTKGLYDFVVNEFNADLALVPPLTWESSVEPTTPTLLVDSLASKLTWSGAIDRSDGDYLTYNVYASWQWPVEVNSANLVAMRLKTNELLVPLDGRYYAVTAMDRYGNQSEAAQQEGVNYGALSVGSVTAVYDKFVGRSNDILPLFACDGEYVELGPTLLNRSDLICIESVEGQTIKRVLQTQQIDVKTLPKGVYLLRSMGKKGGHRLGYFKKE